MAPPCMTPSLQSGKSHEFLSGYYFPGIQPANPVSAVSDQNLTPLATGIPLRKGILP